MSEPKSSVRSRSAPKQALEAAMDIAAETADNQEIELSGDQDDL